MITTVVIARGQDCAMFWLAQCTAGRCPDWILLLLCVMCDGDPKSVQAIPKALLFSLVVMLL